MYLGSTLIKMKKIEGSLFHETKKPGIGISELVQLCKEPYCFFLGAKSLVFDFCLHCHKMITQPPGPVMRKGER